MLIHDIILEIKNYKNASYHKSAFDMYRFLEGNKDLFLDKMNADNFNHLHSNFEKLSYASPKDYNTLSYQRDYQTQYDLLLFYLDRIV